MCTKENPVAVCVCVRVRKREMINSNARAEWECERVGFTPHSKRALDVSHKKFKSFLYSLLGYYFTGHTMLRQQHLHIFDSKRAFAKLKTFVNNVEPFRNEIRAVGEFISGPDEREKEIQSDICSKPQLRSV